MKNPLNEKPGLTMKAKKVKRSHLMDWLKIYVDSLPDGEYDINIKATQVEGGKTV